MYNCRAGLCVSNDSCYCPCEHAVGNAAKTQGVFVSTSSYRKMNAVIRAAKYLNEAMTKHNPNYSYPDLRNALAKLEDKK
jgi:hypothetical protein